MDISVDTAVIGAGMAGLTLASTILAQDPGADLVVLEAQHRPGGYAHTTVAEGYTFEHGPMTIRALTPEVRLLLDRLGLSDRISAARGKDVAASIWVKGGLQPVPTGPWSAARTRILSARGKARLLAEPIFARRGKPDPADTVHQFAQRRFGGEAATVLTGTIVQGVSGGDARNTGLAGFAPGLWRLDQAAGSSSLVTMGLRTAIGRVLSRKAPGTAQESPKAPKSGQITLSGGGLGVLTRALAASLGDRVRYGCPVRSIKSAPTGGPGSGTGAGVGFVLVDEAGRQVEARRVVLAVPARVAARLLDDLSPEAAELLGRIPFTSMRVFGLGWPRAAFPRAPRGMGFLVAPGSDLNIMGVTLSWNYFAEQAPEDEVLVRVMLGGALRPELVDLPGEPALDLVRQDIARVFGVTGDPSFVRDVVLPQAIPQYGPHHVAIVAELDRVLGAFPGLHLVGNSYRGIGLKDTIADAARLGRDLQPRP